LEFLEESPLLRCREPLWQSSVRHSPKGHAI
jgi:hypothetical protein